MRKITDTPTNSYIGSKQGDYRNPYKWTSETVQRLLGMQEYAGDTVNLKSKTVSFKTKKTVRLPKSEWLVFRDTHPAIIRREMFEKAQKRLNRERVAFAERTHEYDTCFRKKCRCPECGSTLIIYIPTGADGIAFNCKNFVVYKTCKSHHVREMTLRNMFRDQITVLQKALIDNPDEVESKLGISELSTMQKEIKESNDRIAEIDMFVKELFESKIKGKSHSKIFFFSATDMQMRRTNYRIRSIS